MASTPHNTSDRHVRTLPRTLIAGALFALLSPIAAGYPNSPTSLKNLTNRDGGAGCAGCHATGAISVSISGPTQLIPGGSGSYTVTATGTNGHHMGAAIATSLANATPTPLAATGNALQYFSDTRELIHNSDQAALPTVTSGSASYTFTFRNAAGASPGTTSTLYAVSRTGTTTTSTGGWHHATNFTVTTIPSDPTTLSATTLSSSSIFLSWGGGSGPRYKVLRKTGSFPSSPTDAAATVVQSCASTGTSLTNSGLAANTTYFYRVYGCDSGSTVFSTGSATDSAATKQTQTITFGLQTSPRNFNVSPNNTFTVSPTATASSGLAVTHTGSGACSGSSTGATVLTILSIGTCTITASQAGNAGFDPAPNVIRTVTIAATVPGSPTALIASPALTTAQISFTAPLNSGGTPITGYTATCSPAGSGTNTVSPVTVSGLAGNTAYTCSLVATNAQGNSPAANVGFTTTNAPSFTSANATTFEVLTAGQTFPVTATGNPNPGIQLTAGTLPTGLVFNRGTSPDPITGTPATNTAGTYNLTFTASSTAGSVVQNFTLTIARRTQAITFPAIADHVFGSGSFTVSATTTGLSGQPIVFTSATPAVCTTSGLNGSSVSLAAAGVCTINANQAAGNNDYIAAPQVQRNFNVTKANQTITFGAQPAQGFNPGGTFGLNPAASASSGLPVTYSSLSTSVCTIAGTTVTIVSVGTCVIAADQSGLPNYNAAPQVSATIAINPVAPGAPSIGPATPGNGFASIDFVPPAFDGGSVIDGYRATCNGDMTVISTGLTAPIAVNGLTNGIAYTCTVAAHNAVGYGAASQTVIVTPIAQSGATLWTNTCSSCHGPVPANDQLNGAGTTSTVIQYVRTHQQAMIITPEVQALGDADLTAIANYIAQQLPAINATTAPDVEKSITVSSHITLGTPTGSFTSVGIVSPPTNGVITSIVGTHIKYMPNPGYTGPDSFRYHGQQTTPNVLSGDPRTVTIDVNAAAVLLTTATSGTGTGTVNSTSPTPGIACGADCVEAFAIGTDVVLAAVADPGSAFIGWSGDCTGVADCQVTMNGARNVTATFAIAGPATITAIVSGDGLVTSEPSGISCPGDCQETYAFNTSVTLTATANQGSTFAGWSGCDTVVDNQCTLTANTDRSATATFVALTIVNVNLQGYQESPYVVSPGSGGGTATFNSLTNQLTLDLTYGGMSGAEIEAWVQGPAARGANGAPVTVLLSGSPKTDVIDLTPAQAAAFLAGQLYVNIRSSVFPNGELRGQLDNAGGVTLRVLIVQTAGTGAGTVTGTTDPGLVINCPGDCAEPVPDGKLVALVANPAPGSTFAGWSGDCSGTGACNVTMDGLKNVTATFSQAFVLIVSKSGAGSGTIASTPAGVNCGATCAAAFAPATIVTLAATPAAGSVFAGWGGDCSGTGSCQVTMSVAHSVSASFTLDPLGDADNDGIPNGVEAGVGRDPNVKDNDVFTASAATNRLFAMQLYRDFLSREGDAAGIQGWTDLVTNGTYSRLQVIDAFLSSQEFAGFVAPVVRLYFATFLRVPDYAGLTFNAGLVRNGTVTVVQLADFFTVSPEFQATYGALNNTQFVTLLYNNVLGRAPDTAGLNGWISLLQSGYTRGQVLVGFSDSPEYQANTANEVFVTMMYAGMLRRTPEPTGFAGWVNFLDTGTLTRTQVINGFFLSTEYYHRFLP